MVGSGWPLGGTHSRIAGSPAATTTSVGFCLKSSRNTAGKEEEERNQGADRLRLKKKKSMKIINSTNSACVHKRELIVLIKVSVEEVEQTESECPESPPFLNVNIDTHAGFGRKKKLETSQHGLFTHPERQALQVVVLNLALHLCRTQRIRPDTIQLSPSRLGSLPSAAKQTRLCCHATRPGSSFFPQAPRLLPSRHINKLFLLNGNGTNIRSTIFLK